MVTFHRLCMSAVTAVAVIFLFGLLLASKLRKPLSSHDTTTTAANSSPYHYDVSSRNCTAVSKWVVMTSSTRTPPAAVRVILNSTEDWCVLVLGTVAGLKYDFLWTNGTTKHIYLPREALALLPYKLATLTSLDVKNIGYLYAIANGARVVLDLEDGIVPIPIGRTYLPMQNEKREYPCPNLEEKEGTAVIP